MLKLSLSCEGKINEKQLNEISNQLKLIEELYVYVMYILKMKKSI